MRCLVLAAVCGLVGCGDNIIGDAMPLATARDLVVVAHQDDDLLFMQPDVLEAVRRGDGVTTVYVTAGNDAKGLRVAADRDVGLMQAYGQAVGDMAWSCGYLRIAGHLAQHCRLPSANLSLVFLAYPDGGKQGEGASSLLHLWEGTIERATTIADRETSYSRDELVEVIAELVRITQADTVRTLEVAATHGHDHSDHMIVGALTVLAMARAGSDAELISYRGYSVVGEPVNQPPALIAANRTLVGRYDACATGCAPCGDSCDEVAGGQADWTQRRYAVGFRRAVSGALELGGRCLDVSGPDDVRLGDCADPTIWTLHAGELEADGGCLVVLPTGDVGVGACLGGPERRFFADDEGHLWSGVPPEPQPGMEFAHLRCLVPAGPRVGAALCGIASAPVWHVAPPLVATARAGLGLAATGRAVRLGDLTGDGHADLCAVEPGGLLCAPGDGAGAFAPAIRIDHPVAPLAIDPASLTFGDVDGDGRLDACGRDPAGILCARSARGFAAARFTSVFADPDARSTTSASLAATDADSDGRADICGLAAEGVVCAPGAPTFQTIVRSAWPGPAALVWPADLDGDHRADWCATSPAGPTCGVDAEAALTRDGVGWGFALGNVVEDVPADPAITGTGDIDGDGDADLCVLEPGRVRCARSQGRGFGPRTHFATVPANATALWLGDLDGDGKADACVDAGAEIDCALAL
jgi:LmbE family N-acetylglucosaminyl deacetylase